MTTEISICSKDEIEEIWLSIKGYAKYFVSNLGRIKSHKKPYYGVNGKILKPTPNGDGYLYVTLTDESGIYQSKVVHLLVLYSFKGNPESGYQGNHINGIKSDNSSDNLEWITPAENVKHAFRLGLRTESGENNNSALLTNDEVYVIKELFYSGDLTQTQIGYLFGVSIHVINKIKMGKNWNNIIYP